ncbi:MAG: LysM peptidoglycan-binding domain-containing protein [Clostridia bacterium]|nr:LysM peptidoglycan-binding domain-containing protein [Clostridia bacterium]
MIFYDVKPGDTLTAIAKKFNTTVSSLILYNGIPNPENLAVGQCVVVVYPRLIHKASAGEGLFDIAEKYGVSLNKLFRNNPQISDISARIYPGESIVIELDTDYIGDFETGGYTYTDSGTPLIAGSMPFMNYLMPFTYGFDERGSLTELADERFIDIAHAFGRKCFLHLSTLTPEGYFSDENANTVLADSTLQDRLIDNTLALMQAKGYDGLDIDFEFIGAQNAYPYAEFIGRARQRLNRYGYEVFAALAPKTDDSQKGVLYEGHLYREIGEAADAVLLMTYEWGYTMGPAMPVSPVPSVRRVLDYAVTRIPREKIFMGMSNYGYDWTLPYVKGESVARSLSTDEALFIASENGAEIKYDTYSDAPYFNYTRDNLVHEVWFEDARSISARLKLVAEYGFRGCLYWNLSRRNVQNLLMINLLTNLP